MASIFVKLGIHVLIVERIDYCFDENIEYADILPDDTCDDCDEVYGFGYEPGNFMVISMRSLDSSCTFLHEFGHNRGLSHNFIQYNVMNDSRDPANHGNDISSEQAPAFSGSTGAPIHFPVISTGD